MSVFVRYTVIVLAVLVFAIIFVVCGEGSCGACVHMCCVKSDRADRLRTAMGRILGSFGLKGGSTRTLSAWLPSLELGRMRPVPLLQPPLALAVSPLRI